MDIQHVSSGSMMESPSKYGRDQKYVYKKSSYQYSTNTDGNIANSFSSNTEQNVNQLDALLEDLKNEREQTREKDIHTSSTSFKTIEPTGTVTKTTRIIKSHQLPIEVENVTAYNSYNSSYEPSSTNEISTYKSNKSVSKNINTSTSAFETSNTSHSENNVLVPVLLENDAKTLQLSDDILPIPGTKVTTTVRTYTYEIPADQGTINNRTMLYKNNVYNSSSRNELISEPTLPHSVVYSSESYNTLNGTNNGPNNPNVDRQVGINSTNRIYEINETQDYRTLRNEHLVPQPTQPTTKTIVYNINKTEHNTNTSSYQGAPSSPNNVPSHTLLPQRPQQSPHHPNGSTNNYYYRESTNTVNTISGSPGDNLHPNYTVEYTRDNYGPRDNNVPQNTSNNVTYNYSSSTINSRRGPNYDSPTSQPPPFPVDGIVYPDTTGRPPAKLNDLLDSLGEDNVDSKLVDTTHRPKREIETALATTNQQTIPSVNKAGPAVYYPPGHDWLAKKEESMAAGGYSASGKYAKASGMYEYESGYKSKSSSKSGAAVVPVCLPLCCAMPCSIM
ncbi:putative uncharacterized protein DDB_G0285119 [Episyrphus balteatus]|uniref:putative uncharacterized protein DDB_G0285119 n=1 Tax=Episyrphus balteatus TaxID=286459 RepID=UPI002485F741|nr:putative uncharacterized protein DDB_G0285119 [Episyrphus balteatus]